MSNPWDYVNMRGDLSFEKDPINEVDLFLLSQIAMPDYEGIVPEDDREIKLCEAAKQYFKSHTTDVKNLGVIQAAYALPAFEEMGRCVRFRDILMSHYGNKVITSRDEQFSAITLRISEDLVVISYRGTDDTIIGWKEDCNIAIMNQVPAQKDAVKYLKVVAGNFKGRIVLVGHSKGGNLAAYAAVNAPKDIRQRILYAISFDGPGFRENFFGNPNYEEMKSRIVHMISKNSIIGTLMESPAVKPMIVDTTETGLKAHDGFNWVVKGPRFVRQRKLTSVSETTKKSVAEALGRMTDGEKKQFVDDFFSALLSTGAETLTEIKSAQIAEVLKVIGEMRHSSAINAMGIMVFKSVQKARVERLKKNILP